MRLREILDGQPAEETAYDRFGMKWELAETRSRWKKSWYSALVASARLNPLVEAQVLWRKPQPYGLDELKSKYLQVLAQANSAGSQADKRVARVDPARLKARVAEAQSFDELIEAHRSMTGDYGRPPMAQVSRRASR